MAGVTMADVARAAGVSKQTVSRVINNHSNVSPATRTLVENVIERLDYRPNALARMLARESLTVGVVSANLTLYGPSQIVRGAEAAARERGYFVSLASISDEFETPEDAMRQFFDQSFDAVLLVDVDEKFQLQTLGMTGAKHLITAPHGSNPSDMWLSDRSASCEATEHLLALGHRRIAHVGGPERWPSAREREQGWREAMNTAGLAAGPLIRSDWSAEGGYLAGSQLVGHEDVTAIVAASDEIALGVISAYRARGLSVPDDISVVGYDNIPSSAYFAPPLTTVARDFQSLGARYVDALDAAMGMTPPETVLPAAEMVVRKSTAAPART